MGPTVSSTGKPAYDAEFYDKRYSGSYMGDEDGFTIWSHRGIELQRVKETLAQIPAADVRQVLDYGCGAGSWIDLLSRTFPQARITGIDISAVAVGKARARFPNHRFAVFDGTRSGLEPRAFDVVFTYHVLEHVEDIRAVVADMSRLVRQGGHLCVIFPCGNEGSLEERFTRLVKNGKESTPDGYRRWYLEDSGHLRRMKSAEIVELFRQQGVELTAEYYGNQRYGAIERLSKQGYRRVARYLQVSQGVNLSAKFKLAILKIAALKVTLPIQFSQADLAKPRSGSKQAVLYLALPLRWIGRLFTRAFERLAVREWECEKQSPNGSAQYLIFRRST